MRKKLAGSMLLLIGVVSGAYGVLLLAPVVWGQVVAAATATAAMVSANANAFAAFQAANPATVGLLALFAGAIFVVIGYLMAMRGGTPRKKRLAELDAMQDSQGGTIKAL